MIEKYEDAKLTMLYESNGLFAKIIDTPAEEAMRSQIEITGNLNRNTIDNIFETLEELNWEEAATNAIRWARLFGGAIVVMLINDGGKLEDPLNWKRIKSVDDIRVFDRSDIQTVTTEAEPEFFVVTTPYSRFTVHRSRCLVFKNAPVPEISDNSIYRFWGIPEFWRIQTAMKSFEDMQKSTVDILHRFTQPIYRMKGLSEGLQTEEGEKRIWKRLEALENARGLYRTAMIDTEEKFDFLSVPLTGISEIVETSQTLLSAVTCIPRRILFGNDTRKNAFGLSVSHSTDEFTSEIWYNHVAGIQAIMLKPNLAYLLRVLLQAAYNNGDLDEIPKFSVKFSPLWSMSEDEKATAEYKKALANLHRAKRTRVYHQLGAIRKKEIRKSVDDIFK